MLLTVNVVCMYEWNERRRNDGASTRRRKKKQKGPPMFLRADKANAAVSFVVRGKLSLI